MLKKGNKIDNWNDSYKKLKTTYSENLDTPSDLIQNIFCEFVLEDIERFQSNPRQTKILECGCGGARTALYLAKKGFEVTCSDSASEALRLAQNNFASVNVSGVFLQDDLLNSKISPESFDCVMSFGLLEHFEDLRPLLASTTRLVKAGGLQIHNVIPKKLSTLTLTRVLYYPYFLTKNLLSGNFEGIFTKSYRDFPHYENTFTAKEYCRAFEHEGNTILRCDAQSILLPLITIPLGIGDWIVRTFPNSISKLIRKLDRSQSTLLHLVAPSFTIVCRKKT